MPCLQNVYNTYIFYTYHFIIKAEFNFVLFFKNYFYPIPWIWDAGCTDFCIYWWSAFETEGSLSVNHSRPLKYSAQQTLNGKSVNKWIGETFFLSKVFSKAILFQFSIAVNTVAGTWRCMARMTYSVLTISRVPLSAVKARMRRCKTLFCGWKKGTVWL